MVDGRGGCLAIGHRTAKSEIYYFGGGRIRYRVCAIEKLQ